MTINKSQVQTLVCVMGLYLPKPVFVHGQLNVALHTCYRLEKYTYIYVTNHGRYPNDENVYTKNIVYKEVLDN